MSPCDVGSHQQGAGSVYATHHPTAALRSTGPNMMRKRCGTCNSLRDCCCKGRERGVVLVKAARIPEHKHTLSAEGRRAAAKREQQQAVQQHGAVGSGEYRPPVRSGAHWPTEVFHAQPNVVALRKEKENAGSMKHLTAEGRRAAQMRLPKAEQQPRAQGSGPRRPAGPVPVEHESVRLRHLEQQQTMSDAEKTRAEQRARQEKFALEQQQEEIVQQKMQLAIATDPDSYAANAALARQIASKQSGAAVNYIFSAGYGYEEPAKQYGTLPNFEVRAPWD